LEVGGEVGDQSHKVNIDTEGKGDQPQDGREGREHHRPQPGRASLDDGVLLGHPPSAELHDVVHQDNIIIHHNARQGDDADKREEVKGSAREDEA